MVGLPAVADTADLPAVATADLLLVARLVAVVDMARLVAAVATARLLVAAAVDMVPQAAGTPTATSLEWARRWAETLTPRLQAATTRWAVAGILRSRDRSVVPPRSP